MLLKLLLEEGVELLLMRREDDDDDVGVSEGDEGGKFDGTSFTRVRTNDSNFTKDVIMHASPTDIVGIDSARAYYANYITGFSNISFTIKDVFGQGDKLVKHWNFAGTHSGDFFGIPATGKKVSLDGVTLVRMSNGKIAEERDFFDNLEFMTQLGLMPAARK